MSRLSEAFKDKKALIAYITAGDPSLKITEKLVYDLEKAGADVVELGIPFSDPLADGAIIQASHIRGLKSKTTLSNVFSMVKNVRKKSQIPLVFMLAYNLVEQYGAERFYADCEKFEVDGVIIPDLPPEEIMSNEERVTSLENRVTRFPLPVSRIFLIALTTKDERIKKIADASSGFVYAVSALGVTGKRASLSDEVSSLVNKIKKYTDKPVAVGFGISDPKQAAEASKSADGVIVGSAIVDLIGNKKYKEAIKLVSNMRKAIDA